jgi:tRNA uridine 5-carboxymethylaminomethyl modification enzyme
VGLVTDAAWADYLAKQERLRALRELLECTRINAGLFEAAGDDAAARAVLGSLMSSCAGLTLSQVLKRPEIQIEQLAPVLRRLRTDFFVREEVVGGQWQQPGKTEADSPKFAGLPLPAEVRNELKSVETEIKYAGYLDQQTKSIERLKKAEQRVIPEWFDYGKVSGLSREMNEKLTRVRPRTLGQASRIPGVTPAAVSLINVYIEIQARQQAQLRPA